MDNKKTATIRPGALSLLLRTARIAGVAPLSFKKLREGYIISVSGFQLAYSFLVITSFNVIGLRAIFLNIKNKVIHDFQTHSKTLLIVFERMTCILICCMGYMGATRMKHMIEHINILEKIRTKINYGYYSDKEDSNVMWMACFLFILNFIFTLLEITFIILHASVYDIGLILFATHYLQYNLLNLLKIQVVVMNFEVYKVFFELNARLRSILKLTNNDNLRTAKSQVIKNGVRRLTQCYVSVCDVVTKINNADGLYMFLIYACFALFSVFSGYRLILAINNTSIPYRFADITLQSLWCVMIIIRITFFVEPYQRISSQVDEMKVLLAQLMYNVTPSGNQVSFELDVMIKQVTLNVPKYCPLGINTLNRSLITVTLNAIITFLVFMVQLQS